MAKKAPADPAPAANPAPPVAVLVAAAVVALTALYLLFGRKKAKFLNKTRQQIVLGAPAVADGRVGRMTPALRCRHAACAPLFMTGERTELSHDTVRLRFNLPKSTPVLGLPVGQHFKLFCPNPAGKVKGEWNGREDSEGGADEIERKYTPTTSDDELGYVDLVIKATDAHVARLQRLSCPTASPLASIPIGSQIHPPQVPTTIFYWIQPVPLTASPSARRSTRAA